MRITDLPDLLYIYNYTSFCDFYGTTEAISDRYFLLKSRRKISIVFAFWRKTPFIQDTSKWC